VSNPFRYFDSSPEVLAMDMLGRARRAETLEWMQAQGALATKLLRTFTAQTEALAKLKRGGEQTVRVEHVHVYHGGHAIVGAVSNRRVEGGGDGGIGNQRNASQFFAQGVVGEDPTSAQ
jgi:hypothetical protein